MSNLHEFINPPAPIALTALTNDLLKQIEDLAIRVGGAQERAQISNENAMLYIARCAELEAENAKLKKENDELLNSAMTIAHGDDLHKKLHDQWVQKTDWIQQLYNDGEISGNVLGDHRADVIKTYVDQLKAKVQQLTAEVESQNYLLAQIRADDAAELKRWWWAIDLRSASDDKRDGAHLADWLNGYVHDLNHELNRSATREAESQAQAAEAITDAQAVQMIAQDLEAHAEEIGLVATGVTDSQGRILYRSKSDNNVPDELADHLIKDGYTMHHGLGLPVDMHCVVKAVLRDGQIFLSVASNLIWNNTGESDDIIAYQVMS